MDINDAHPIFMTVDELAKSPALHKIRPYTVGCAPGTPKSRSRFNPKRFGRRLLFRKLDVLDHLNGPDGNND